MGKRSKAGRPPPRSPGSRIQVAALRPPAPSRRAGGLVLRGSRSQPRSQPAAPSSSRAERSPPWPGCPWGAMDQAVALTAKAALHRGRRACTCSALCLFSQSRKPSLEVNSLKGARIQQREDRARPGGRHPRRHKALAAPPGLLWAQLPAVTQTRSRCRVGSRSGAPGLPLCPVLQLPFLGLA